MIVRIMGEGQFEVDDSHLVELNRLDDAISASIDSGDDAAFRAALSALLDSVRTTGTEVAADSLDDSDLVLPYAEAHVDEVRKMLSGDGLIPGSPTTPK
ncbi:MAG: PspA-associated protein PspAA [Jiangellaceae bacterium]